jgi:multiple sugar transport system permease protein
MIANQRCDDFVNKSQAAESYSGGACQIRSILWPTRGNLWEIRLWHKRMQPGMRNGMRKHLTLIFLTLLAAVNLAPLVYMMGMSLHGTAAESGGAVWLGPWIKLWRSAPAFGQWVGNSFAVAALSVGFHLVADSMAGYVLAKRRFRGRGAALVLILVAMMIPRQVTLIPLFLGMARLGLADTFLGLLLPGLGDVVGIFLMRQFFVTLPDALLESARIDGASEWGAFRHIAIPLARPALGVLAALSFQHYWSDFFWPLVITQTPEHFTLQVGLAYLSQSEFGPDLPLMAAGATAAAVPILAVFLAVRRQLFEGLRAGALRG